jgi:hypothetical protein
MCDDTPISFFAKRVREPNPATVNPRFTNGITIQVLLKDGNKTEAYTEKLSNSMEFVNEHGKHPIISQCLFIPFGIGAVIKQDTFCLQNEFLHNLHHIEIHGLADINLERHLGNDMNDGEGTSNSIRELVLYITDAEGQTLFHSIEHTMKSHTVRAIFTQQNQSECNEILNAYTKRISKILCLINPNEPDNSFDAAPKRMTKQRINLSYTATVVSPSHHPVPHTNTYVDPQNYLGMIDNMSLAIPTPAANKNSSSLAELESSLH